MTRCLVRAVSIDIRRCLGHGTGPWDGVFRWAIVLDDFSENFVDVDMRARTLAVDEWMIRVIRRETQSVYWQASKEPIDAFQAICRRPSRATQPEVDA